MQMKYQEQCFLSPSQIRSQVIDGLKVPSDGKWGGSFMNDPTFGKHGRAKKDARKLVNCEMICLQETDLLDKNVNIPVALRDVLR